MEPQKGVRALWLTSVSFLLLAIFDIVLVARFKYFTFVEVPTLKDVQVQQPANLPEYQAPLNKQNITGSESEKSLQTLRWVTQTATKIDTFRSGDPIAILNHIQSGGGVICSNLAIVLRSALATQQIPSRKVWLMRNMLDTKDTHVTVEVLLKGKWVLLDPTFNLSFTNPQGELLSAQEVHNALLRGESNNIKIKEYGQGKYPLQLKDYYIHFLPLFNNVFVVEPNKGSFWYYLPKVGVVSSLTLYYEHSDQLSNEHLQNLQSFHLLWGQILPFLNLLLLGVILYQLRGFLRQRARERNATSAH